MEANMEHALKKICEWKEVLPKIRELSERRDAIQEEFKQNFENAGVFLQRARNAKSLSQLAILQELATKYAEEKEANMQRES